MTNMVAPPLNNNNNNNNNNFYSFLIYVKLGFHLASHLY